MTGQLSRRAVGAMRGEGFGVLRMQSHPLAWQQVLVDRLGEQRVAERIAVGVERNQDVRFDRPAKSGFQCGCGEVGAVGQQRVRDMAPGHGGCSHGQPPVIADLVQPHEQQVGEIGRKRAVADLRCGDQLLDEERVALRAGEDVPQVSLGHRAWMELADQLACLPIAERPELKSGNRREAHPLGERSPQRVPAMQVVAAVGREDRDRRAELPGEQHAHQVPGRLVGPMHVFDDEQQRCVRAQLGERPVHRVEQGGAFGRHRRKISISQQPAAREQSRECGVGLDQGVRHARSLGGQPTERLAEREIGRRAFSEVETVTDEHPPAVADDLLADLGDEPALAGTGVAAEQYGTTGTTGHADQVGELAHFLDPSHEGGRCRRCWHLPIMVAGNDGSFLLAGGRVVGGRPGGRTVARAASLRAEKAHRPLEVEQS